MSQFILGALLMAVQLISGVASGAVVAPANLSATAKSSTSIELRWLDQSTNETQFNIERSQSATSGFSQIAIVSRGTTVYLNSSLASGTYYYRVRAYRKSGSIREYSAYSNIASAQVSSTPSPTPTPTPAPTATPSATPTPNPTPSPTPSTGANLLIRSGFESGVTLNPRNSNGMEMLSGIDSSTGFDWSKSVWGGWTGIQILTASWQTALQTVTGRTGASTRALYMSMNHVNDWQSQIPLIWSPTNGVSQQTDLYQSVWIKFQPDMNNQLVSGTLNGYWGNWRAVWEIKTGTPNRDDGDYRINLMVNKDSNGLYWQVVGDNRAGPAGYTLPAGAGFNLTNRTVPIPLGQWFRFETFLHRSAGSDGRFWAKVNGQVIFDRSGPNMGAMNYPINRYFIATVYTNGYTPAYQWIDDLEIWDRVPY